MQKEQVTQYSPTLDREMHMMIYRISPLRQKQMLALGFSRHWRTRVDDVLVENQNYFRPFLFLDLSMTLTLPSLWKAEYSRIVSSYSFAVNTKGGL